MSKLSEIKVENLENKGSFFGGFIAVILGAIGLGIRDNENVKPFKTLISIGSTIAAIAGLIAMALSLDKTLLPVDETESSPEDEDELDLDDDLDLISLHS